MVDSRDKKFQMYCLVKMFWIFMLIEKKKNFRGMHLMQSFVTSLFIWVFTAKETSFDKNKGWRWKMYQKGWGLCATASGAGPRYIRLLDQVITVSADVLAPNGARTSTDTVLTTKLNIFPLMFIWPFTDLIAFQFLIAFCKIFPAFWELTKQLHCCCVAGAYFTNNFYYKSNWMKILYCC